MEQTEIKNLLKKQAILDIIMTPEPDAWRRLVTYNYDKSKQCDVFKIDNGEGDHLYAIFSAQGAIFKGFDHESRLSPYQNEEAQSALYLYDQMPTELLQLLGEDTEKDAVTFCLWQLSGAQGWQKSPTPPPIPCQQEDEEQPDDGGQAMLLSYIFPNAEEWYQWAAVYYELQEEAWDAAALLYETGEITRSMMNDLNPNRDYDTIIDECEVSGLL